ncbi:hypothetical protein N7533_013542 [Penicillium manginii]|uniref:uncharacterized protein n=1 Tax=Penicillium manginii TaxID=203109 RepID=UPI00254764BE|nr:uncharacterized protein N7533_013542 [Penicillium manginii]KAJ5733095.1 hypothetical protein N7533_013542 [Penicillium manginii]
MDEGFTCGEKEGAGEAQRPNCQGSAGETLADARSVQQGVTKARGGSQWAVAQFCSRAVKSGWKGPQEGRSNERAGLGD